MTVYFIWSKSRRTRGITRLGYGYFIAACLMLIVSMSWNGAVYLGVLCMQLKHGFNFVCCVVDKLPILSSGAGGGLPATTQGPFIIQFS